MQLLIRITQSVPFPQNIVWILPFHPQKSKEFIPSFHEIAIHTDLRFIIQKSQALGTNPFAVAIPGAKNGPIMFDMATSKVAKSKINKARLAGESIPSDWALDTDGNPTTDPLEAIKGTVLPMAEYKGYGIAMAIDIIAGVLSGAGYLNGVNRFYSDGEDGMNVGQVFVAIDPRIVMSDSFYSDIDGYINQIHACEPLGDDAVLYPGERKNKNLADSLKNGVEITAEEYETIMRFKDEK